MLSTKLHYHLLQKYKIMDKTRTQENFSHLRLKISQYVHELIPLSNLQKKIMEITWSRERVFISAEANTLADHAELIIAEYTDYYINEEELRRELLKMISQEKY